MEGAAWLVWRKVERMLWVICSSERGCLDKFVE